MSSTFSCIAATVNTPMNKCSPVTAPEESNSATPTKYGYTDRCTVAGTRPWVSISSGRSPLSTGTRKSVPTSGRSTPSELSATTTGFPCGSSVAGRWYRA